MIICFEFSLKKYCPNRIIFAELKKYFGDDINFLTQREFWAIVENSGNKGRVIGLDVVNNRIKESNDYETFVNAFSNFKDIRVMLGFYRHISEIRNTEVAFGGFTEEGSTALYLYDINQKLYDAYIDINSNGLDIVVSKNETIVANII